MEAFGISARGLVLVGAFAVLAFGVLVPVPPARAAPPAGGPGGHVRLLQPSAGSPRARRCLTRVREELESGGFEVALGEFAVGGEGLWMVDPPSPEGGSIATIALIGDPDEGAAELWIVNGVPWGRAVVRRLLVPAGAGTREDEVLAIRALEFLRASALELAGTRPASPPPSQFSPSPTKTSESPTVEAVAAPAVVAPADPAPPPPAFAVELGISLLESARVLGPAYVPVARARAEWLGVLETRLTLAAFGTEPDLKNARGTAAVGHALALAELRAAFRHGSAVRPAIGLGAGALRVRVEGAGNAVYDGASGERWAALFDVGAGLTVRLGERIAVAFELHGQLSAPAPTVRFADEEVARIGRPALFSSLTLVTPL